jgi:hypothetical protein
MVEYNLPLVEFGTVVTEFFVAADKWPNIVAITTGIVGQKRK